MAREDREGPTETVTEMPERMFRQTDGWRRLEGIKSERRRDTIHRTSNEAMRGFAMGAVPVYIVLSHLLPHGSVFWSGGGAIVGGLAVIFLQRATGIDLNPRPAGWMAAAAAFCLTSGFFLLKNGAQGISAVVILGPIAAGGVLVAWTWLSAIAQLIGYGMRRE